MNQYTKLLTNRPDLFSNDNAIIKIVKDEIRIVEWVNERKKILKSEGKPEDWASIGVVLDDPYILIVRDLVEFPDGRKGGYSRILNQADLRGGQSVVVFAEMNKKYLLLHIYRHPTRCWSYEAPRGFGEPGILADNQARSEITEEVEGEIAELVDLGIYHSNTGLEGNAVKLFYAKLKSVGKPAKAEGIENTIWVTLVELEDMISNAQITDGFTIAAYTRAKLRGLIGA